MIGYIRLSDAGLSGVLSWLAVLNVTPDGFALRERAPGVSVEEIQAATAGRLVVLDGGAPEIQL